ncbi:MAG: MerR family transcriptional regulator [Erythrobacter sp.]
MLSAREVSRLAGFEKPWMLNHLEREEIFAPEVARSTHHGKHRQYTFQDLVVLRAINRMLELGARPKRIKTAIETFKEACPQVTGDTSLLGYQVKFASESGHFVVTQSEVLYCRDDQIIDLLKSGQLAFSFMINNRETMLPSLQAAAEVVQLSQVERRRGDLLHSIAERYEI